MKACFILHRRFAPVGHAIAVALKTSGAADQFCAYVELPASREFLLDGQHDIDYRGHLFIDEEIFAQWKNEPLDVAFIKQLETDYGMPNLWPYIELDRVLRHGQLVREYPHDKPRHSHEELMRIFQTKARAIINFLKTEKPDFLVTPVIADLSTLLFWQAAKKLGIRTFFFESSRVGTLNTITEDYWNFSFVDQTFDRLQKKELRLPKETAAAEKFLTEFRSRPKTHSHQDTPNNRAITRKKQFAFLLPWNIAHSVYWFCARAVDYARHHGDEFTINPWYYLWDRFKRKLRVLRGFSDLYKLPSDGDEYAFFPLQVEPEMATSLFSKFYTDQLWLIKQTARALPLHYKLYVKEHPSMYGYRTRAFYKEIAKIPNVKLIPPAVSAFALAEKAKLIVTLTGTSGWEAAMLKKPVITFGDVYYNKLPWAKKCNYINDLPALIAEQLAHPHYDEQLLVNYLAAIFKESADVDLIQMWEVEGGAYTDRYAQGMNAVAELIANKL